ncbi:MAG TPA: FAD-binding oxidoreductase [Ignavibacteriaceae bacterium]|nr:FAD-binding oxidoreductase [Ignavibacteriaceae bacterium]
MLIKSSPDEIQNFIIDASNTSGYCDAVYFPENKEDIIDILKKANAEKTPVTVCGNHTGLTGAGVPRGGIVISTEKLNKIIEINTEENFAIVQPGVILADFLEEIKNNNRLYPPDPTENNCFLGGTVATNASGAKTFKYGPTRNYVIELEIILPGGETLNLKRNELKAEDYQLKLKTESGKQFSVDLPGFEMPRTKNASGYFCKKDMDAIDLFIGSEGTLGIITKIKLKLLPAPDKLLSCVIFFNDEKNALSFVNKARELSYQSREIHQDKIIDALALEFFDEGALKFLSKDFKQVSVDAKAAIWFEQEINKENEDPVFEEWMELISEFKGGEGNAWFALSDKDKANIKEFRHAVSWKINEYMAGKGFSKLGTDVAVPPENFEELYFYAKNEVGKSGLKFVNYGHFGDAHMHLNMLPESGEQFELGKKLYGIICKKAIELGGTVSAEHGIGKNKTNYLLEMYGEENIKKMAAIKKKLDPNLILGIGNIFDKKQFI